MSPSEKKSLEKLLPPEEVCEALGVPLTTLYGWRYGKRGPKAMKVGRHLRYRSDDVEAYLASLAAEEDARQAGIG